MVIYPDDLILVAIMNNKTDWRRVQEEGWYRIPVKHAPKHAPNFDWLAFYFTRAFGRDKWAIHYYAPILGHEVLTRQELIPSQPNHKRAGDWYYNLELGKLQHKIPPIISYNWRRITFIVTTGDRFEVAEEINDLFEDQSPAGRLYVTLKEEGYHPERDWPLREKGVVYQTDLALPLGNNRWLPIIFTPTQVSLPANAVCLPADGNIDNCLKVVKEALNRER